MLRAAHARPLAAAGLAASLFAAPAIASLAAADPVAGSSGTPSPGANIRVFQRAPEPAVQLACTRPMRRPTATRSARAPSAAVA